MDNPVCSCSICKAPMTQYHLNCLEEAVSKRQNETKELVKKLNDLKRENAEYRKKLQDGKIGREIEEHKEAAKKKTLESKKDTYEGFNIIAEEKIEKGIHLYSFVIWHFIFGFYRKSRTGSNHKTKREDTTFRNVINSTFSFALPPFIFFTTIPPHFFFLK